MIVLDGTSGITTPTTNSTAEHVTSVTGFKNRIINGGMVIDQRNAGASVTPVSGTYTLDRWVAYQSVASKFSIQQNAGAVTSAIGFSNYLGSTSLSAYSVLAADFYLLRQNIEGFNFADLAWGTANASTVTLSFRVYSSLTGTFGGSLQNSANTRSYPFSYSIPTANTWTTVSVSIVGDTSGTWIGATNGIGICVTFSLGTGSTSSSTAGAWATGNYYSATGATSVVGTNGATFYITGVQLEKGSVATSFDYRPYGTELALCQRYYWQTLGLGGFIMPISSGDTNPRNNFSFPVTMRANPTITGTTALGTFTIGASNTYGFALYAIGAGAGAVTTMNNAYASAEL